MRALAVACGVSQPFLSAVERGGSTPSIATLYRLAEVLGTRAGQPAASAGRRRRSASCGRARAGWCRQVTEPNSAMGRVVFSDPARNLEIYEYAVGADRRPRRLVRAPRRHRAAPHRRVGCGSSSRIAPRRRARARRLPRPPRRDRPPLAVVGDEPIRLFLLVVVPTQRRQVTPPTWWSSAAGTTASCAPPTWPAPGSTWWSSSRPTGPAAPCCRRTWNGYRLEHGAVEHTAILTSGVIDELDLGGPRPALLAPARRRGPPVR